MTVADQSAMKTTNVDHHSESIPDHANPQQPMSDRQLPEEQEYPNSLTERQLRKLRRRVLRGIDLKTLRGVVTFGERVIHEAVKGNLSKKSADTLSRMAGRQAEKVALMTEDEKLSALAAKIDAIEGRLSLSALAESAGARLSHTENPAPLISDADV